MLDLMAVDNIFDKLSKYIKREVELVVCGGVSMLINYGNRKATCDVDCLCLESDILTIANKHADDLGLTFGWLNSDVAYTKSYAWTLFEYKKFWKSYGNLRIYTISDLPLLCMKLTAWRPDSFDKEDCTAIINAIKSECTVRDVYDCLLKLYGTTSCLSVDAELFLQNAFGVQSPIVDTESIKSLACMVKLHMQSIDDLPEYINAQVRKYL